MAVKPWLGAVVEPSRPPPPNPTVPAEELYLRWVHGYRALDSTNNLRYTKSGEVVYPVAALGVCFSTKKWQQRYMYGHTDDVICLAMHPDGIHVATGQMGKKPSIVVWRSDTMTPVVTLQGLHRRAVCQLAFSADGRCVDGGLVVLACPVRCMRVVFVSAGF
jgi:WD40 repeat protein